LRIAHAPHTPSHPPTNGDELKQQLLEIVGSWRDCDTCPCTDVDSTSLSEWLTSMSSKPGFEQLRWALHESTACGRCLPFYEVLKAYKYVPSPRPVCLGGRYDVVLFRGNASALPQEYACCDDSLTLRSGMLAPTSIGQALSQSVRTVRTDVSSELESVLQSFMDDRCTSFVRRAPHTECGWDVRLSSGERDGGTPSGDLECLYRAMDVPIPRSADDVDHVLPCFVCTFFTGETCLVCL
jgi:hypothetical protein